MSAGVATAAKCIAHAARFAARAARCYADCVRSCFACCEADAAAAKRRVEEYLALLVELSDSHFAAAVREDYENRVWSAIGDPRAEETL